MQSCYMTITTETDGRESGSIKRDGTMELAPLRAELCYREENALVTIRLNGEEALVVREGEYTLYLPLKSGERCIGRLGINGSQGDIETFARKIVYSVGKDSLLLTLQYDLIFGEERQKMKLRIHARKK